MGQELMNTAEAARFLRVSQASIRRWSDAGLLPGRRVGRRRERRFAESDLLQFLDRAEEPSGHLATFYSSDAGRMRLTVPFLMDGLRSGQPCFLAASEEILELYTRALKS